MSSDEEEFDEFDTTTDYEDDDDDDDDDDEEEEDDDQLTPQPIHFRECLRLLDAALTASNPPILPQWCASEELGNIDDPMILIDGHSKCLSLPLNKRQARRIVRNAKPLNMKIDLVDGISFLPSACQIPTDTFQILNPEWTEKVEPYLKRSCVAQPLQLDPNEIELKIANLILLEPCQFPRQFHWSTDQQHPSSIAKLFISLPSFYRGGKETITHYKEKHVFDLSEKDPQKSCFYTLVPISSECKHEIDFISDGYKLVLVYDIIPLTSTIFYNVNINEATMIRVGKILETWITGLEHDYHGYSSKIIIPFSETFQLGNNPLLHGIDRMIGTLLRRTIEQYHSEKFLLYYGIIQPNRSNDGTVHACRLLTDLKLMINSKTNILFQKIDLCLGNCNETYSGNIFLRKTRSEQGNFISMEQFTVPIWCLVPTDQKYTLLIDNIPRVLTYLEHNLIPHRHHTETFLLIDWLLKTPKKIHFNAKSLLHQLVRLSTNKTITYDLIITIRQLFEHKKFLDQFFPMNNKQDYDDIIYLLNYSQDPKIQVYLHQVFRTILRRRSHDIERIKDAIKFIGILSTRHVDSSFLLVLIHELLSNVFQPHNPMLSITDLTNLLALLSLSVDTYAPSCLMISQQIIRQIKMTTVTTTATSTITNLLRTVLVPTLIQIHRHFIDTNEQRSRKRSQNSIPDFPPWFLSLYQTCLSLLNAYCNSAPAIPTYMNVPNIFDTHCCSICEQLFVFLQNTHSFEQTFLISEDQIYHFNMILNRFNPLMVMMKSMTSDNKNHQIHIMKMSTYDEEIWRENNLLYSLLSHMPVSHHDVEDRSDMTRKKRFKSSL